MHIKDIAAFRRHLQSEFGVNPAWEPDLMGSRVEVDGKPVDGFFKFWQSSTAAGREAIAGKLRGVLEMAQNDQAIYEITQNAADCGATDLRLWYDDEHFLAFNDGEAFDERDVKSILDTFGSEKTLRQRSGQEGMIGQYGVGFKLFHRLVGRESGLEELLDHGAGPMIFSWSSPAQLESFLADTPAQWEPTPIHEPAPWLFKILLTCFPAAPEEMVKDIAYRDIVAFTAGEAEAFRRWARAKLAGERPVRGSLFFLYLGEGKRQVLDAHMEEIRSCMSVSMRFLRKLIAITVNEERIERLPLDAVELRIPREELRGLGFKEEHQDVELVFAYSADAAERLVREPTLYQYFPMTKEAHGMAYVIHSNGLQKQAQRTELNEDSAINEKLLTRIAGKVMEQAQDWMNTDPERYRSLFKAVLLSKFEPARLQLFRDALQQPLVRFIKEHVPTMDGTFVAHDKVRIRRSAMEIPTEALGPGQHWFHWTKEMDESLLGHARDSAKLNLAETTVGTLLSTGQGNAGVKNWLATLSEPAYDELLKEMHLLKVKLPEYPGMPAIRVCGTYSSLKDLLADPSHLDDLEEWYTAHPTASEWLPRIELEAALVALAPTEWNASMADLLFHLTTGPARDSLLDRLPGIIINKEAPSEVDDFMRWWMTHVDEISNTKLRKKLSLQDGDKILAWEEALVLEQVELPYHDGRMITFSLDRIIPGSTASGVKAILALQDDLRAKGFHPEFLEMAFQRRKKNGKEELVQLGNKLATRYGEAPLDNGCQLLFTALLKELHPEWPAFSDLKVADLKGEPFPLNGRWMVDAPDFVHTRHRLDRKYADLEEHLGSAWEPIRSGKDFVLAAQPRLGGAFAWDIVRDDLDDADRAGYLDWSLNEARRSEGARSIIRDVQSRQPQQKILGASPAQWILAGEQLTVPAERCPSWVSEWMGDDEERRALLHDMGLRGPDHPVMLWRQALLADAEKDVEGGMEHPTMSLEWIIAQGGAERFTTPLQERRILELIRANVDEPGEEARPELELRSVESNNLDYRTWKKEHAEWTVSEFDEDQLPINVIWNGHAMVRRNGMKVFAPADGSKRIYLVTGYPLMVALFLLSEGPGAVVPMPARDQFQKIHDERHHAPGRNVDEDERPVQEQTLKQQVEALRDRQFSFSAGSDMTLAGLVNAVEWEYRQKLLDRENGNTFRFKEVEQLPDGVLALRRPNVAELPYELVSDKERTISGMKLKLRKRGVAYQEIRDFELMAGSDGEVRIRVKDLPFSINKSTVALIELPVEDLLLKMLVHAWQRISNGQKASRSLIELVRESAPGGQVGFIFGPPGTGKTTVLADRLIATARNTEAKVLVLTPTNTAADVLYQRISDKASEDLKVLQSVHRFSTSNKDVPIDDGFPAVVITTMHRFCFDHLANGIRLDQVDWDHVVFDEASMAPLAHALLPILTLPSTRGGSNWGAVGARFLFAGDPFQLMPVGATPSLKDRIEASQKGMRIRGYSTENIFTLTGIDKFQLDEAPALPGARIDRLTTNYRSGRSIVKLFSNAFYEGGVGSDRGADIHDITLGGDALPTIGLWAFPIKLAPKGDSSEDMLDPATIIPFENSAVHMHSALLAARLGAVLATENPGKRVIIICPYGRQARICQALLEPFNTSCPSEPAAEQVRPIEVSSVHRYQGGEAEVVIFLLNHNATKVKEDGQMVVGDIALFNDPNLINVAISRARDALILLTPEDTISRSGHSGYFLMDHVLAPGREDSPVVQRAPSNVLEQMLFNGQTLDERVSVMPIRALDVYRVQETKEHGTDIVVLHNKENLNMVVTQDIVMEGIDLSVVGPESDGTLQPPL